MLKALREVYLVTGDGTKEPNLFMRCPLTRQQFPIDEPYPQAGEVRHITSPFGFDDDVEFVDELPPEPAPEGGAIEFNATEAVELGDGLV